jgi:predicted restriction endonuclease
LRRTRMKFELEPYRRNVSDEELLNDLKKVASSLKKKTLTEAEYNGLGTYCARTFEIRFGAWKKALAKAGLQPTRETHVSDEEYFANMEQLWEKLGRQPHYSDIHKPFSSYSIGAYVRRFGTWRKALEKFVAYINKKEHISSEAGIKSLKIEPTTRHKTSRTINWRLRFLVMRRDDFKCKICGVSPAIKPGTILHVDHIKAWTKGGETVTENLHTLCNQCNIGKSNLSLDNNDKD